MTHIIFSTIYFSLMRSLFIIHPRSHLARGLTVDTGGETERCSAVSQVTPLYIIPLSGFPSEKKCRKTWEEAGEQTGENTWFVETVRSLSCLSWKTEKTTATYLRVTSTVQQSLLPALGHYSDVV